MRYIISSSYDLFLSTYIYICIYIYIYISMYKRIVHRHADVHPYAGVHSWQANAHHQWRTALPYSERPDSTIALIQSIDSFDSIE